MHHYLYAMYSDGAAPAGGGDIKSWFEYYKLDNGPGTSIPFFEVDMPEDEMPLVGDLLWFVMDAVVIGVCKITGATCDPLNKRVDVFYDSDKVVRLFHGISSPLVVCGMVTDPERLVWLEGLRQSLGEAQWLIE